MPDLALQIVCNFYNSATPKILIILIVFISSALANGTLI